jgi:hypothetical protein
MKRPLIIPVLVAGSAAGAAGSGPDPGGQVAVQSARRGGVAGSGNAALAGACLGW